MTSSDAAGQAALVVLKRQQRGLGISQGQLVQGRHDRLARPHHDVDADTPERLLAAGCGRNLGIGEAVDRGARTIEIDLPIFPPSRTTRVVRWNSLVPRRVSSR